MRAPGEQPTQDKVSSDFTFFFKIPSSPEHVAGTLPQTFYLQRRLKHIAGRRPELTSQLEAV